MRQDRQQVKSVFSQSLTRFNQAAIFVRPATEQKAPMLDQGQQEFGINLTQNLMRVLGTPFVE
jgi:hypothetical protein